MEKLIEYINIYIDNFLNYMLHESS